MARRETSIPATLLARASVCSCLLAAARADVVTLKPVADNTIFLHVNAPGELLSNGAGDGIFSGRTFVHADYQHRGLVRFDLSSLPCGATITGVSLTLTLDRAPRGVLDTTISLHRLLSDWGEGASDSFGGSGTPSEPDDANWYHSRSPSSLWTTPGGDFVAPASASASVSTVPGPFVWNSSPALVADVALWVSDPSSNFGWLLLNNENARGTVRKFASKETPDPASRPILRIEFHVCPADFDCDGMVDFFDYDRFVTCFEGVACPPGKTADFDGDGSTDFFDYDAFVVAFESPC